MKLFKNENKLMKYLLATTLLLGPAASAVDSTLIDYQNYAETVKEVAQMTSNPKTRKLVNDYGLSLLNVTWEDTGRSKASSMGPNISDMTIQVHTVGETGDIQPIAMPVVRYPNFSDKTADLSPSDFYLLVGNEKGEDAKKITLTEYLANFRNYLSDSASWKGEETSLLAPRDTYVLISPQVTFLPVPKAGKAHFNPVLFNYQSSVNNPAVLAIVATREGTSATIIDNKRDAFNRDRGFYTRGQRLFFNHNGEKASFSGERESEYIKNVETDKKNRVKANGETGLNMVLLIQVPLKHITPDYPWGGIDGPWQEMFSMAYDSKKSMIQNAVIGHGPVEGPFVEIDQLKIERDERFPIRVTVQFYKATDSSELTEQDVKGFRTQIDKVFKNADFVGSLVTEGQTSRPTEHNVPACKMYPWWSEIWPKYNAEKGLSEKNAVDLLQRYYGQNWRWFCLSENKLKSALNYVFEINKTNQ
ncbi:hypothetical protein N9N67_11800 [Bacteriovoracaceae bacterium]|nr:hypothetical protein [Bacteriovoracaceae bacterium]